MGYGDHLSDHFILGSNEKNGGILGGDWPGCHVAHGKAPWILGLEVPSGALEGAGTWQEMG
jgi:hypothetical protein